MLRSLRVRLRVGIPAAREFVLGDTDKLAPDADQLGGEQIGVRA